MVIRQRWAVGRPLLPEAVGHKFLNIIISHEVDDEEGSVSPSFSEMHFSEKSTAIPFVHAQRDTQFTEDNMFSLYNTLILKVESQMVLMIIYYYLSNTNLLML